MDECGSHIAANPDKSCCFVQAPLPESQYASPDLSFLSTARLDPMGEAPSVQRLALLRFSQDPSPPPLQPLLCTFLI